MSEGYQDSEYGQEVTWDLRQFYVNWLGKYIANFSTAHLSNRYYLMYESLEKWHSVVWGRTMKIYDEENNKDEKFEILLKRFIALSNNPAHRNTYLCRERKPEAVAKLDGAVNDLVVYLVWLMKKHKLFGTESSNRGLT